MPRPESVHASRREEAGSKLSLWLGGRNEGRPEQGKVKMCWQWESRKGRRGDQCDFLECQCDAIGVGFDDLRLRIQIAEMEEAMAPITIKSQNTAHAKDEWIRKRLSKADQALNPEDKPGRNAMTLVRGNRYVEPVELTRQCNGRVNEDGITPEEDEDAPRETFCDVR